MGTSGGERGEHLRTRPSVLIAMVYFNSRAVWQSIEDTCAWPE